MKQKDFLSGILFTVVGGAFAWGAREYEFGTGSSMGPGYFPTVVGCLLAFVGVLVVLQSLRGGSEPDAEGEDRRVGSIAWRPLTMVVLANVVFGLCLGGLRIGGVQVVPVLGLIIGIFGLVFLAGLADADFSFPKSLLLATALSACGYLLFIVWLGLVIPVWPVFK